jgi:hypothetical protein
MSSSTCFARLARGQAALERRGVEARLPGDLLELVDRQLALGREDPSCIGQNLPCSCAHWAYSAAGWAFGWKLSGKLRNTNCTDLPAYLVLERAERVRRARAVRALEVGELDDASDAASAGPDEGRVRRVG